MISEGSTLSFKINRKLKMIELSLPSGLEGQFELTFYDQDGNVIVDNPVVVEGVESVSASLNQQYDHKDSLLASVTEDDGSQSDKFSVFASRTLTSGKNYLVSDATIAEEADEEEQGTVYLEMPDAEAATAGEPEEEILIDDQQDTQNGNSETASQKNQNGDSNISAPGRNNKESFVNSKPGAVKKKCTKAMVKRLILYFTSAHTASGTKNVEASAEANSWARNGCNQTITLKTIGAYSETQVNDYIETWKSAAKHNASAVHAGSSTSQDYYPCYMNPFCDEAEPNRRLSVHGWQLSDGRRVFKVSNTNNITGEMANRCKKHLSGPFKVKVGDMYDICVYKGNLVQIIKGKP